MSYKVGQILYIVPAKQTTVYPMQVVEEITKKTLNGIEVDYILKAGSDSTTISHKSVNGEIFETAEKARIVLTERASRSIAKLIESAYKKSKEWYQVNTSDDVQNDDIEVKKTDPSLITLEDGTVARVKLPDILKDLYLICMKLKNRMGKFMFESMSSSKKDMDKKLIIDDLRKRVVQAIISEDITNENDLESYYEIIDDALVELKSTPYDFLVKMADSKNS